MKIVNQENLNFGYICMECKQTSNFITFLISELHSTNQSYLKMLNHLQETAAIIGNFIQPALKTFQADYLQVILLFKNWRDAKTISGSHAIKEAKMPSQAAEIMASRLTTDIGRNLFKTIGKNNLNYFKS